jgi:hypothetical protein
MAESINTYNYLKEIGTQYATINKEENVTGIAPKLAVDYELKGKLFVSFPNIKLIERLYINADSYLKVTLSNTSKGFLGKKVFYLEDTNIQEDLIKLIMKDLNLNKDYKRTAELVLVDGVNYIKETKYEPYVNTFLVDNVSEETTYPKLNDTESIKTRVINFIDGTSILVAY